MVNVLAFVVVMITLVGMVPVVAYGATTKAPINWLQLCKKPVVDAIVAEPCEGLTTPDGYTLNPLGQSVMACLRNSGVMLLADPSGHAFVEAQIFTPIFGCREVLGALAPNPGGPVQNNSLGNISKGLSGE
jgi:hypothetical protein